MEKRHVVKNFKVAVETLDDGSKGLVLQFELRQKKGEQLIPTPWFSFSPQMLEKLQAGIQLALEHPKGPPGAARQHEH